jgi:hypothetical protein
MTTAMLADGTQLEFPDGTSQDVISKVVKQHISGTAPHQEEPQRSFGNNLLHQAGLTVRDAIEGTASTAGLVSDPMGYLINKVTGLPTNQPMSVTGQHIADNMGLPTPDNGLERGVNETAKLLVGTGGMVKGAGMAAGNAVSPVAKASLQAIAARPDLQATSTIGSGLGGSYAKENGAGAGGQFVASLAGGLAAPLAQTGIKSAADVIKNFLSSKQADAQVLEVVKNAGVNLDGVTQQVKLSIINDVKSAVKTGDNLDADAIRRLADYRTVGAVPMRSSLTLNPADITNDRNLAKLSANSRDPQAQQLANLQRNNDVQLVGKLNELGANTAVSSRDASQQVIDTLGVKDKAAKGLIDSLYTKARATDGRSAMLDPHAFTNRANDLLDEAMLGGKVPASVVSNLNKIATGQTPLTVDVAEQYKTAIAGLQRASNDPAEKLALGKIRQALEETPLLDGQGQQAIDAFNKARSAHKAYMGMVDKIPALQAVRDGVEPDKFMQTFILGNSTKSSVSDVAALRDSLKNNPDAVKSIRDQMLAYIKNQALGGKADEVANFSPSNFDKALNNIGDMKLGLFMDDKDIAMLKTIGRVGSYEKFQPTGSAVNNSNSAAAVASIIDKIASNPIVRKIPLAGSYAANTAQDILAKNALNVKSSIATKVAKPMPKVLPLGALLYGSSASADPPSN